MKQEALAGLAVLAQNKTAENLQKQAKSQTDFPQLLQINV